MRKKKRIQRSTIVMCVLSMMSVLCFMGCSKSDTTTEHTNVANEQTEMAVTTELQSTTETSTEVTTEVALDLSGVYQYYAQQVAEYQPEQYDIYSDNPAFIICDLDGNEIPELYIGKGDVNYPGSFLAYEMYVGQDYQVELDSGLRLCDGGVYYTALLVENTEASSIYENAYLQWNSVSQTFQPIVQYYNEFVDEGGGFYQITTQDMEGNPLDDAYFEQMLSTYYTSIYQAYGIHDENIALLSQGVLPWNVQPSPEKYQAVGYDKVLYGRYEASLAVGDGAETHELILQANNQVLLRHTNPETGELCEIAGTYTLYASSYENNLPKVWLELIIPEGPNSELFYLESAENGNHVQTMEYYMNGFGDQWHGYSYVGE